MPRNKPIETNLKEVVREWIDLHQAELAEDWQLAKTGNQVNKIPPLE